MATPPRPPIEARAAGPLEDPRALAAVVPRLAPSTDPAALSLEPAQARVLAEIDGQRTVAEICARLALPEGETVDLLQLLCIGGAVVFPRATATATEEAPPRSATRPRIGTPPLRARTRNPTPTGPFRPAASPLDIDDDTRRRIDELLALGAQGDPHALLGVAHDSDERTLRRAYFQRARELHPDRYFGRQLGPYRARLQRLFAALADAYHRLQRRGQP